jgi:hypothetical protein
MSKERAAKIANSLGASKKASKQVGKGGSSKQGGTTAQKRKQAAQRDGGGELHQPISAENGHRPRLMPLG